MEASNAITTLAISTTNDYATSNDVKIVDAKLGNKQLKKQGKKRNMKLGGQTSVWRAALLFFLGRGRRKATKAIQAEVVSDANNWTMLVGCMRPMNLQGNESTLMLPEARSSSTDVMTNGEVSVKEMMVVGKQHDEEEEDVNKFQAVITTPLSPSSSSECSDSRYASALNLQDLDKSGSYDDDDESEEFDDTQGDAMIDMKAEMFIAQFYAQMRIDENTSSA